MITMITPAMRTPTNASNLSIALKFMTALLQNSYTPSANRRMKTLLGTRHFLGETGKGGLDVYRLQRLDLRRDCPCRGPGLRTRGPAAIVRAFLGNRRGADRGAGDLRRRLGVLDWPEGYLLVRAPNHLG